MHHKLKISVPPIPIEYEIKTGFRLLDQTGNWAKRTLGFPPAKVALISDETVFALYGEQVIISLSAAGYSVFPYLIKGGERRKDLKTVAQILDLLSNHRISRTDAVLALGGGVVGDIAGFAASIHLRGISFLNVPTTLLSMIDSSVGGKTGVNSAYGKNLIGAFHQPSGVLVDLSTLATLPQRELTAGLCEAIKQGAVSGHELLEKTERLVNSIRSGVYSDRLQNKTFRTGLAEVVTSHIAFKADIVAGDERESSKRLDRRSRKILNFGHTLAHALEKVTKYKYLRHGEAVGYGIMFAAELSKSLALCSEKDVKLLNDVVHRAGSLPSLANIEEKDVFEAFKFDKKNTAGLLQMVLLKGIGKPVIVAEKDIPLTTTRKVLGRLLKDWA